MANMKTLSLSTAIAAAIVCYATPAFSANPDHVQRLLETNQCPQCDLSGADLGEANLYGANLVNANLTGANLAGANLGEADFTDANLTGAKLNQAYLRGAILENTNLSSADLTNAYLRDAVLMEAEINNASLQGVNLSRTNLSGIDLQGVNLSNANLKNTIFSGFIPANFSGANSSLGFGAFIPQFFYTSLCNESFGSSDIVDEELEELGFTLGNLKDANFSGANLSNAILIGADLSNANLSNANLRNTCLAQASLKNANLDNANLQNAQLNSAIVERASFRGAEGVNLEGTYATEREAFLAPKQSQALSSVRAMGRAQQYYYSEEGRFTTSLAELGLGFGPEDEFYRYLVVLQGDNTQKVKLVTQAKEAGLKSYTGAVFVVPFPEDPDTEYTTVTIICESNSPSKTPPSMPETPKNIEAEITCPVGSSPIVGYSYYP
ncbi:MAG: pentapeptide repeat-containing protein [Spirulinaceae cyanobacterium]